jgi:guanylate kinase
MIKTKKQGNLIIVSGTTCAGKGSVIRKVIGNHNDIILSISYTTRPKRDYEINGVEYFFISEKEFKKKISNNEFLEYAEVHKGIFYGTSKNEILKMLKTGKDVILEVDVEGAKNIKSSYPNAVLIFIMAPSMEEVKRRIKMRGYDNNEQIISRFKTAYNEINRINDYNYVVVNDDLAEATRKVEAILLSEKLRVDRIENINVENQEEIIHEFLIDKDFINKEETI